MINKIDLSIIIPTFNRFHFLSTALNSILVQKKVNFEVIIIDDCSTDNTFKFLKYRYHDHRIKIFKNKNNLGAQKSRNIGISKSRGEFITFLDSDDYLFDDYSLFYRLNLLKKKKLDVIFSGFHVIFQGKKYTITKKNNYVKYPPKSYKDSLKNTHLCPTSAILYRKDAFKKLRMDENLIAGHDDDIVLQMIRDGKFIFDKKAVFNFVQHFDSHIGEPKKLIIADAQLLLKYKRDILTNHSSELFLKKTIYLLPKLIYARNFMYVKKLLSNVDNFFLSIVIVIMSFIIAPIILIPIYFKSLQINLFKRLF